MDEIFPRGLFLAEAATQNANELVLFFATGIGGLAILAIVVWITLRRYLKPETFADRKEMIGLFVQVIGGATLLVSIFTAWKSIRGTQDQLEQSKQHFVESQRNESRKNRNERFFDSMKSLESSEPSVRAGAIYSLGQLANEAAIDEDPAYGTASEVVHTPNATYWGTVQLLTGFIKARHGQNQSSYKQKRTIAPVDLAAAMYVLGNRRYKWNEAANEGVFEPSRLNLESADLRSIFLRTDKSEYAPHFEGIQFYDADLENANFKNAIFDNAVFERANLQNVEFSGGSFTNTGFNCANVARAKFVGSNVTAESLSFAKNPLEAMVTDQMRKELKEVYPNNRCEE